MPPTIISPRPAKTTRRLPKRWPSRPPGSAKTTPGSMKRPMSSPTCAQEMSNAVTRNGVSAAMDWNWKPSDVRVKKITSSIAQRSLMRPRVRDGQRERAVAGGAVEAPTRLEAAARLERLLGAAARAGAAHLGEPPVFLRALHGHDDAGGEEGGHQDEVRHRDEEAAQRQRPEHAEPHEGAAHPLAGGLLDHHGGGRARREAERGERDRHLESGSWKDGRRSGPVADAIDASRVVVRHVERAVAPHDEIHRPRRPREGPTGPARRRNPPRPPAARRRSARAPPCSRWARRGSTSRDRPRRGCRDTPPGTGCRCRRPARVARSAPGSPRWAASRCRSARPARSARLDRRGRPPSGSRASRRRRRPSPR